MKKYSVEDKGGASWNRGKVKRTLLGVSELLELTDEEFDMISEMKVNAVYQLDDGKVLIERLA